MGAVGDEAGVARSRTFLVLNVETIAQRTGSPSASTGTPRSVTSAM
jgi:hypothetical protein